MASEPLAGQAPVPHLAGWLAGWLSAAEVASETSYLRSKLHGGDLVIFVSFGES